MNELYWLTRLDSIVDLCEFITFFTVVGLITSFILYTIVRSDDNTKWISFWKKGCIISIVLIVFFCSGSVFIPTSKDAMLIWGVGGTIDYIKSNDKIQQLPDKCADALDAWVESLSEDDNDTDNK